MRKYLNIALCVCAIVVMVGCKGTSTNQNVRETLFDKTLPEVKALVDGRWELISGENATEMGEFENTFITFDGDRYIWSEDGVDQPDALNWRLAPTGAGYDAWLMDVFYADSPSYPLAVVGDTLYIQDCTETAYKYTLLRRK